MWPCCDITSSDDDEHNTDSSFLLLFADIGILPNLLDGLTDVDVLHIALGCRFALDIFTISQQYSPAPDHEPLPLNPELFLFLSADPTWAIGSLCLPTGLDCVRLGCLSHCVHPSLTVTSCTH